MIKNLNIIAKGNIFLEADFNDQHIQVKFSDIVPYWNYATEDDYEGGRVYPLEDKILFTMLTASGQGGAVIVWDLRTNMPIHVSNASYCVAAKLYGNKVYTLCDISNYMSSTQFQVYSSQLGTMNAFSEDTRLYCQNPCQILSIGESYKTIDLHVTEKGIGVILNRDISKAYRFSTTLDESILSKSPVSQTSINEDKDNMYGYLI